MNSFLEHLSDNIEIDKNKCVFCGKCADVCLLDNIRLKMSPCRKACPLNTNCQGYVQLIARGEPQKALELIMDIIPYPGILGRICPHPCEEACYRNETDGQPIAIRSLKRYVADSVDLTLEWKPVIERAERVAVVGAGPAGVTAAYDLRKHGYQVSIFDASDRLGGMLTNCIPEFRLPAKTALKELSILEKAGVEIHYNTVIGKNVSLPSLAEEYDAVILAVGLQNSRKLGLAGEDSPNVTTVLEFLRRNRDGQQMDLSGKNVVVIGGGNAAIDAGQVAMRLGAKKVQQVCLEQRDEMPAFKWEIEEAAEEGVVINNGWGPVGFQVDKGEVTGVEFRKCLSVFDEQGNFTPVFSENERMALEADTVIVAIGQQMDLSFSNETGLDVKQGVIVVDPVTLQTNLPNIFAAGDAIPGKKSVVDAMALGKEAAESVYRMIEGLPLEYARDRYADFEMAVFDKSTPQAQYPRVESPMLNIKDRKAFTELEGCLSRKDAEQEAARCISCGEAYGKFRTCWSCLPCELECPEKALAVKVPYLMR